MVGSALGKNGVRNLRLAFSKQAQLDMGKQLCRDKKISLGEAELESCTDPV